MKPCFYSLLAPVLIIASLEMNCRPAPKQVEHVYEPRGFEEVTNANDGDLVAVTDGIDIKGMCLDVNESQREICTTSLVGGSDHPRFIRIKLWVCSESRRNNCLVWPPDTSQGVDFRDVYVLDDKGQPIDFDGETLIEPPNTWTSHSRDLTLTGRVRVINGRGELFDPIEKIEPAPELTPSR
jgi:hypothetical protein